MESNLVSLRALSILAASNMDRAAAGSSEPAPAFGDISRSSSRLNYLWFRLKGSVCDCADTSIGDLSSDNPLVGLAPDG